MDRLDIIRMLQERLEEQRGATGEQQVPTIVCLVTCLCERLQWVEAVQIDTEEVGFVRVHVEHSYPVEVTQDIKRIVEAHIPFGVGYTLTTQRVPALSGELRRKRLKGR